MQDRFKVRMYDKNAKKMWDFSNDCCLETVFECLKQQLAFESQSDVLAPIAYDHISDGRVFMQCREHKDKNGKILFDCDVVMDDLGRIYIIEPAIGTFQLQQIKWLKDGGHVKFSCYNDSIFSSNYFEIIGNIYENPELLEGE